MTIQFISNVGVQQCGQETAGAIAAQPAPTTEAVAFSSGETAGSVASTGSSSGSSGGGSFCAMA